MPRFFFNVRDGRNITDDDGTELPDWNVARIEAIALAGRIIADDAKRIPMGEDWAMEVMDERGVVLFKLDFHVTAAADVRPDGARHVPPQSPLAQTRPDLD